MTIVEHLDELRRRLLFCVAAVSVGTALGFAFHDLILALLLRPLPAQAGALGDLGAAHRLAVTGVGEAFAVVLKLSLATGIALATPIWLYHLCAFVAPALRGRERRYALPFALLGAALFVTGLGVGFVTLRYPMTWLLAFSEGYVRRDHHRGQLLHLRRLLPARVRAHLRAAARADGSRRHGDRLGRNAARPPGVHPGGPLDGVVLHHARRRPL